MRFIVPLICSILAMTGVSSSPVREEIDIYQEIHRARVQFNAHFLTSMNNKSNGKNQIVSAFGIHSALSAVLAGAKGETFNQLWGALG